MKAYACQAGRGQWHADLWFMQHALGVATPGVFGHAVLFALVFLVRTAMDWRVPPADFHDRALITTGASAVILLIAGTAGRPITFVNDGLEFFSASPSSRTRNSLAFDIRASLRDTPYQRA